MDLPLTEQTHSGNLCPLLPVPKPQLEIPTLLLRDKYHINCSQSHSEWVESVAGHLSYRHFHIDHHLFLRDSINHLS